jgi:glycerol-3-phosphate dehydrogenase
MARDTRVVVVGGGATGTGLARDLARRGVAVTLLEADTLSSGTTGRMHGLLHSGARYAVADQETARECIAENEILRDVAAHCVEPTGGLFVELPSDSADYFERKVEACRACDIPVEVISGAEAREREPALSPAVERAIAVPDAAIDPFRLSVANAVDAERHGATVETHARVTDLVVSDGAVVGVEFEREGGSGTVERIEADHVVNAAGPWAGEIAGLAAVTVDVQASKGAMTVLDSRPVDTVVNRCRPKQEGDILVPHETTAILGTTDEPVEDPAAFPESAWEVDLLVEELSAVVPSVRSARTIRSYWGVRPLYEPDAPAAADSTAVSRDHVVLDHAERDGVRGLTTVVGGKLTTFRLMAAEAADQVCARLGVEAESDTASAPLPGSEDPTALDAAMERFGLRSPVARRSRERLGSRAGTVLGGAAPNPVLCECEAVTRAEVRDALSRTGPDLQAVRIRTRAGMGSCQGGRCGHRLAAELVPETGVATARGELADFRDERFRGQRFDLWGSHLAQAMLNYRHEHATMNEVQGTAHGDVEWAAFDAGPEGTDGD